MYNYLKQRIKHAIRFRHKRGYGVHSPFVYDLITRVIREKGEYYDCHRVEDEAHCPEKDRKLYRLLFRLTIDGKFADGQIDTARLEREMDSIHISFRLNPQTGRPDTYLNGQNVEDRIRTMEVSARVSPVSALPFVRQALVARQQEMGREKGIVMDGRDIGTTVFPDAELKVFVTAAPEIRAQRRYDELKAKGQPADYDDILANVKQRDDIDQHRAVSPLRRADDALLLDNGEMTIEEQKAWLLEQYRRVAGE